MRFLTIIFTFFLGLYTLSFASENELNLSVVFPPQASDVPVLKTNFKLVKDKKAPIRPENSWGIDFETMFTSTLEGISPRIENENIENPHSLDIQLSGLSQVFYNNNATYRTPLMQRGLCKKPKDGNCKLLIPSVQLVAKSPKASKVVVRIFRKSAILFDSLDLLPSKVKKNIDLYLRANTRGITEDSGRLRGYILYTRLKFEGENYDWKHNERDGYFYPLNQAASRIPLLKGRYWIEVETTNKEGKVTKRRTSLRIHWGQFIQASQLKWEKY
jgi:hypothetical protein